MARNGRASMRFRSMQSAAGENEEQETRYGKED